MRFVLMGSRFGQAGCGDKTHKGAGLAADTHPSHLRNQPISQKTITPQYWGLVTAGTLYEP